MSLGASLGGSLENSPVPLPSSRRSTDEPRDDAAAAGGGSAARSVPPWLIIGAWIALSTTVILYKCAFLSRSLLEAPQLTLLSPLRSAARS